MELDDGQRSNELKRRRTARVMTPTDFGTKASKDIAVGFYGVTCSIFLRALICCHVPFTHGRPLLRPRKHS
jgi:hypothetical protein